MTRFKRCPLASRLSARQKAAETWTLPMGRSLSRWRGSISSTFPKGNRNDSQQPGSGAQWQKAAQRARALALKGQGRSHLHAYRGLFQPPSAEHRGCTAP